MKIINIAIALAVFIGACMLGSANTGGMGSLWDGISLAIVVVELISFVAHPKISKIDNSSNFFILVLD